MVIWSFTPRRCTSILALASFGLSLCFVSGEAKAIVCDCNLPPEPEGAFVLADSVFHGILTGAGDLPDENLFSFSLVTLWKGSVQGEVFSFASCKCCTPCLKVGEEYLIYAVETDGALHANHPAFFSPFGGRAVPYTPAEAAVLGPPIWTSDGLPLFQRGDANSDGRTDMSDAMTICGTSSSRTQGPRVEGAATRMTAVAWTSATRCTSSIFSFSAGRLHHCRSLAAASILPWMS